MIVKQYNNGCGMRRTNKNGFKRLHCNIPDYPEKGIVFRDISPLMANGDAYREATKQIVDYAKEKRIDMVVGPSSWLYCRLSSGL